MTRPPTDPESRRHGFYRLLLVACLLVLGSFALPGGWTWLPGLLYNLLPLLLLIGLARPPFCAQQTGRLPRWSFSALGLGTLAASLLWHLTPLGRRGSGTGLLVLWSAFGGWCTVRLVRGLSRERRVNGRVLMGALAGYLLMGLTAGLLFGVLESLQPGSFRSVHTAPGAGPGSWALDFVRLNSFAFVSLTTTGFGDVVPVSPQAQIASLVVAVSGNSYLAIVMALLISRYTVQDQQEPPAPPPPPPLP
ncbi:MAG: potassium channel family protein [Cyanobacteriota bacterium]|nr:potassium channel family protein [Cyanobacteriota bacterium]